MVQPLHLYLRIAAILFFIATSAAGSAQESQKSVDILHTSQLLGYYRLPETQNGQARPSPTNHTPWCFDVSFDASGQPLDVSAETKKLVDTLRSAAYLNRESRILVGTGDNFALNLPARVFDVEPPLPDRKYEYSKDQFNWDWKKGDDGAPIGWVLAEKASGKEKAIIGHGFQVIPTDNVACFLAYAGYDAIVPGRHDFYYGAERVRSLARLLASVNSDDFHPVQMLAANLLMKSSWVSAHSPILDSQKARLPFNVDGSAPESKIKIKFPQDGAEVLPWLSRIELERPEGFKENLPVILLGPEKDPDKNPLQKVVDVKGIHLSVSHCWFSAEVKNVKSEDKGDDDQKDGDQKGGDKKNDHKKPVDLNVEACTNASDQDVARPAEYHSLNCDPPTGQPTPSTNQQNASGQADGQKKVPVRCYLSPVKPMMPGYYKVCTWQSTPDPSHLDCNRFTIAAPFLQFPDPDAGPAELPSLISELKSYCNGNDHPSKGYCTPKPYLIKLVCPSGSSAHCEKVAIFGVVDPDLAQQVGEINGSWLVEKDDTARPIDRQHKVAIKTVDAAKSLKQLIDYWQDCIKQPDKDNRKFCYDDTGDALLPAFKVLLANMTPQKASAIATQLTKTYHFDVVISDHDTEWFTRDEMVIVDPTVNPGKNPDIKADCVKTHCNVRPFLVVPPPAWDDAWKEDPVRLLRITKLRDFRLEYLVRGAHAAQTSPSKLESTVALRESAASGFFGDARIKANQKSEDSCIAHLNSPIACGELQSIAKRILGETLHPNSSQPYNPKESNEEESFRQATLATLLKKTHADVAMLQKADFWFGPDRSDRAQCLLRQLSGEGKNDSQTGAKDPPPSLCADDKHELQKLLDIIVWKGDTFIVMPVRGSVLQALMKRSKDYASADANDLSPEDDLGRELVTMGIENDGNDYRVNGLALDPNRLYSVVTTDFVASGDTDYPEFIDATLPSQPRPFFDKKFQYISSAVCEQYIAYRKHKQAGATKQNGTAEDQEQECSSAVNSTDYYDSRDLVNPRPPVGNTWGRQVWLWMPFHFTLGQARPKQPTGKEDPERWAQEYPIWKLSLDKGSVGFSVQRHSDSQADLNRTFGGVGSSQVLASNAHQWNTDVQFTYLRSYSAVDFVFSPELVYSGAFTEAKQGGFRNPNQPADTMSLDSGFRIHVLPQKRQSRRWSLDPSIHFETQPFALIQSLSVPSSSFPLQFNLPRSNTRLARLGLGRYDRKSYFQVGLEGGGQFGAFKEFDFPGTPVTCVPLAAQSLQQCVNAKGDGLLTPTSRVKVVQEFRYRSGIFWHSLLVTPVGPRLSASLENQGEFFFNNAGDNSTDTRLQHIMTAKVSFPIWPMISVSPTYQFFYYENKLAYKSLWQQQALLTLDYRFDWTNTRISRSQLRYKNPQTSQK